MKPIYAHLGGAIALSFTIAACVPAPDSTPQPQPSPTRVPVEVAPAPAPSPMPQPAPENWIDEPRTPGNWNYSQQSGGNAIAQYVDARGAPLFSMMCMADAGNVALVRHDAGSATPAMTIRTETADRSVSTRALSPDNAGRPTIAAYVTPTDTLLDAMALTRGRFAVETPGLSTLYLPPWGEVTRVIEDCR